MPTVEQIRAAIKTTLQGVSNIGQVHDYERYAENMPGFRALYQSTIAGSAQVRGWYVRRLARQANSNSLGRFVITTTWRIAGFMSFDDANASEKTFDTLCDAVVAAFIANETLSGVVDCVVVGDVAGLQIDDTGPVMFGGVLCHSMRGRLLTQHFE